MQINTLVSLITLIRFYWKILSQTDSERNPMFIFMTCFLISHFISLIERHVLISGRYFREFKLSSLESKPSIETRESRRESRLSKFSKFSIRNIVKWIFLAKNRSNYLSTENFMNCSTYSIIFWICFCFLNKKFFQNWI